MIAESSRGTEARWTDGAADCPAGVWARVERPIQLDHTTATGTGLAGASVVRTQVWGQDLSGTMQGAGGVGGLLAVRHGGQTYVPLMDGNGNVMGLQGLGGAKDGQTVARYDYDAFGNRITNTAPELGEDVNPFGFSTKFTDEETVLVYYGFRYYQPETGRWPSRDPIGERGGINLYGMIGNDGVNQWDYLGLRCKCGPNATSWFLNQLRKIYLKHANLPDNERGAWDGMWFLDRNGDNMDATPLPTKGDLAGCATGDCKGTYLVFGKCMTVWTMNNMVYGFVSRLLEIPPGLRNDGAQFNNISKGQGMEGVDQQAAYGAGSRAAETFLEPSRPVTDDELKGAVRPYLDLVKKLPCKPCGRTLRVDAPGKSYGQTNPRLRE